MSFGKKLGLAVGGVAIAVGVSIAFPQPLFAHVNTFGPFTIYSDRPIPSAMGTIIGDAERRLRSSELYREDEDYRVFICNEPWRLLLLARSMSVGAATETLVTRNIYIREADLSSNKVLIGTGVLADAEARPLSYFIAHEAAHVIQSRRFGRLMAVRYPRWLIEGHADLVAKAGDFDVAKNRHLLRQGDELLTEEYARTGLYRRYHLMVHSIMKQSQKTAAELFAAPPREDEAVAAAMKGH